MIANDLPSWVPIFNLVVSVTALGLAVFGLSSLGWTPAYRVALVVALVLVVAGALFQSDILPLWTWVFFGSVGRLVILALIAAGTVVRRSQPQQTHLDDIVTHLDDIQRLALGASDRADAAHTAASAAYTFANAADDRTLSQGERVVAERERGERIEDALAENTDLTRLAADHADAAYREANSVNEKIAAQGAALVEQGDNAADDRARVIRIEEVSTDTNERAQDIQGRLP